ncbi:hypothetical protein [Caballeronia sp. Sq4a]|uniref:hypothetical protein n=1 Tax=Caballeronia sp. Sq4a TaxID=2878152 RepID=UPI0020C0F50C|nr:hypothetical protein [Caballeronia sp. Sq4a]
MDERRFHSRKRVRLTPPQSHVARGSPVHGGRRIRGIRFPIQREQFRFAEYTVRVDALAERLERRRAPGEFSGRRRNTPGAQSKKMGGFDVVRTAREHRKRVAQGSDEPARAAHVAARVAIRCVKLRFGHAVQIAAIQGEMLAREARRCRAFMQRAFRTRNFVFEISHLRRGYQLRVKLTT